MPVEIKNSNGAIRLEDVLENNYTFPLGRKIGSARLTKIESHSNSVTGFQINSKGFHLLKETVVKSFDEPRLQVKIPLGWVALIDGKLIPEGAVYVDRGQTVNIHKVWPLGIVSKNIETSLSYE